MSLCLKQSKVSKRKVGTSGSRFNVSRVSPSKGIKKVVDFAPRVPPPFHQPFVAGKNKATASNGGSTRSLGMQMRGARAQADEAAHLNVDR